MHALEISGRAQNGFEIQNGLTMSSLRGMPSLVPKLTCLVVEIALRTPPQFENFFRNYDYAKSHGAFSSGMEQDG